MNEEVRDRFWTIPNFFSLLRVAFVPVFVAMMVQRKIESAFAVFLAASATDLLDGMTARLWRQRTKIGGLLDPAADKLLMTAAIIVLSVPTVSRPNTIPIWLTGIVVSRDLAIGVCALVLYKLRGQSRFAPTL
ncbi:MAG: CDP-alcohol phosphatidyltransferase family protein, partial [Candidatus Aminicenantales bacterium]